jgi:L-lysine exporter family protein LysE/ArgO
VTCFLLRGFATAMALIVAIGPQNAFVLRQGIRRQHVLAVVAACAASDLALIAAGVAGFGALIAATMIGLAVALVAGSTS